MLSVQDFKEIFPRCQDSAGWVNALSTVLPKYGITTPRRQAAFIAQCGHESAGWSAFVENLNYSAKALNTVFPKYFTRAGRSAEEYARNPEKIANVVYAGRMGNGDIASGDGWRYRGRGPIQLTGRSNYAAFGNAAGVDVLKNPDLVQTNKEIGLMAALWFWNKNGLNELADVQDIKAITKRINGGYNGLEDRIALYKRVMSKMGQG
jgi:putative chitinase